MIVEEIGLFTTQMRTYDGIYVEVPNGQIWTRPITNYSRVTSRRLDLVVGISYEDNIDKALAALMDLLVKDPKTTRRNPSVHSPTTRFGSWVQAKDYFTLRHVASCHIVSLVASMSP